jgi:hypothetical protein
VTIKRPVKAIRIKKQAHERDKLHIPLVARLKAYSSLNGAGNPNNNLFTIHHSPNENTSGAGWQRKLWQMSVRAGEPDLRIDFAEGRSLYVELKWEKHKIEKGGNQDLRLSELASYGNQCYVLNANDETMAYDVLIEIIKDFVQKKPPKESLEAAKEINMFGERVKIYAFASLVK